MRRVAAVAPTSRALAESLVAKRNTSAPAGASERNTSIARMLGLVGGVILMDSWRPLQQRIDGCVMASAALRSLVERFRVEDRPLPPPSLAVPDAADAAKGARFEDGGGRGLNDTHTAKHGGKR